MGKHVKLVGAKLKIGKKGINPRFPVLKQALLFDNIMGPILSHIKLKNSSEHKNLKKILYFCNNAVFEHVKSLIPNEDKTASLEIKQCHNDTISWLRTRWIKTVNKIEAM